MYERLAKPRLWSDFDGVVVELARPIDPRNWLKYPLRGVPRIGDFLLGVREGGVEIAGVNSHRINIELRRWATRRSIAQLGLQEFFGQPNQLKMSSRRWKKAAVLIEESRRNTVAMLEDKPFELGTLLLERLTDAPPRSKGLHLPIVLGVVNHDRGSESTQLLKMAAANVYQPFATVSEADDGIINIVGSGQAFQINVVPLPVYSEIAGVSFAKTIKSLAIGNFTKSQSSQYH